jgi:hypothetical protein
MPGRRALVHLDAQGHLADPDAKATPTQEEQEEDQEGPVTN